MNGSRARNLLSHPFAQIVHVLVCPLIAGLVQSLPYIGVPALSSDERSGVDGGAHGG